VERRAARRQEVATQGNRYQIAESELMRMKSVDHMRSRRAKFAVAQGLVGKFRVQGNKSLG
jgi:hypothetical protein